MDQRTLRTIGASVILVGLGFAGIAQIGASGDDAPVEVAEPLTTTSATDGPTTTSLEPFTYRIGVLAGISTDNFWAFYGEQPSAWNSYVLGATKAGLFTSDRSTGALEPELALSEVSPLRTESGWVVTVDLDPGFFWSDGVPMTAHDLVFTFQTVRAAGLEGTWAEAFPESVVGIHAEGDHRVRIEFDDRPRLAVWPHGVGIAPVMAGHYWADLVNGLDAEALYALSGSGDPGGGPLVIASVSDDLIVSMANHGYPVPIAPDSVEYHVYPSEAAAVEALRRGEVDTILSPRGLTSQSLAELEPDLGVEVTRSPGNGIRYLGFNLEREPMSGQAFRTALSLLLDREGLASSISNTGPVAWSIVPEANRAWFDAGSVSWVAEQYRGNLLDRLGTALGVLADAGYTWEISPSVDGDELVPGTGLRIDGQTPPVLTILTPGDAYDPARPDYASRIAATLEALGFDARPVETDFETVVDLAFTPDEEGALHYDMYLLGWTLGEPALPGYYRSLFSRDGALNNTGYASTAFEEVLGRYERAPTHPHAVAALWEMERILAVDLPYLALYGSELAEVYRSDRVSFDGDESLGGIQARLGGIMDVRPSMRRATLAR